MKKIFKIGCLGILGLFALAILAGVMGGSKGASTTAQPVTPATTHVTETAGPTNTPRPTGTPRPTSTPSNDGFTDQGIGYLYFDDSSKMLVISQDRDTYPVDAQQALLYLEAQDACMVDHGTKVYTHKVEGGFLSTLGKAGVEVGDGVCASYIGWIPVEWVHQTPLAK